MAISGNFAFVGIPQDDDDPYSSNGSARAFNVDYTDVNDDGVPDECQCLGDINDDGIVDIDDLFIILDANTWGPCADPNDCPADLNGDDVVDIDDLFAVLGYWGECPDGSGAGAPQGVMDCILQYASDPEALATCLEAMQLIGAGQ